VGATSTFRQVMERISDPNIFGQPIIITNSDFRFIVAEELRACGAKGEIILEPSRRDSAPAINAAAEIAARRQADGLLLVMASDHVILKPEEFIAAIRDASPVAGDGWIVTFGIPPR